MDRRDCLHSLAASGLASLVAPVRASGDGLRIGLTPVILADQVAFLSRWGNYLTERVGCEVIFMARESYQGSLEMLFAGQIDAAWICGYPYVRFESALSLLAVPQYLGSPTYQAYLIRTKTSSTLINNWADLRAKVLAYSDPLSNSGWLVAQAQLAKAGLSTRDLKRSFFAHGHRNVAESVAAGLAQAGSIDGYVWETMQKQGMTAVAQTEVAWKSDPYGFPPLVVKRGNVHPMNAQLRQALLAMTDDATGRDLLRTLNLTGFTEGNAKLYDSIRRQAHSVPGSGVSA
ncbi:MAG: PhnD/SsuA/transferrin family substrate-binding protein [Betaproteobacteria bacterium]